MWIGGKGGKLRVISNSSIQRDTSPSEVFFKRFTVKSSSVQTKKSQATHFQCDTLSVWRPTMALGHIFKYATVRLQVSTTESYVHTSISTMLKWHSLISNFVYQIQPGDFDSDTTWSSQAMDPVSRPFRRLH